MPTKSSTKQTLIMIHGFRGTHHGLLLIANHLKNHRLVIPDLPGFGKGEAMETYNLENYVLWLHRYVKALQLKEPPVLLGHSFGSIICAAYAEKYPKTIKRLILVNPIGAPALEGPKKVMTKLAILYYDIGAKLPEKTAYKWLSAQAIVKVMSLTLSKTHDKQLRAYIHHQHRQHFSRFRSAQSVLEGFKTSISHTVRDFAPNISTQTLLIAGSLDDITPLGDQYALVKLFPKATLKVINDVGHLTHYETPEQVAKYVQAFIKSV
jgi:pimeloyl-ACP methyl ester carboxylesterase